MGKVFLFEEIQQGLVPKTENFAIAKKLTLGSLQELVRDGEVVGAMVFGSVAKGLPSERSDFDLLVITTEEGQYSGLEGTFDKVFQDTRVGVEPIVIPEHLARNGLHTIDESFAIHLGQVPVEENIVGQNPNDILVPFDLPLERVHEQYLAQKLRRLREGIFARSQTDRLRVLQRALEAPANTGRRTLQALNKLGAINKTLVEDAKPQVTMLFREVFGNTTIVDGFNVLLQQDTEYTQLLRGALSGNVSRAEYDRELNNLTNTAIPTALRWESEIATVYGRLLEGGKASLEGNVSVYRNRERM